MFVACFWKRVGRSSTEQQLIIDDRLEVIIDERLEVFKEVLVEPQIKGGFVLDSDVLIFSLLATKGGWLGIQKF